MLWTKFRLTVWLSQDEAANQHRIGTGLISVAGNTTTTWKEQDIGTENGPKGHNPGSCCADPVDFAELETSLKSVFRPLLIPASVKQFSPTNTNILPEGSSYVPALHPQTLGDAGFRDDHGLTYAYVAGAMANGIASVELVEAMSRAGMLGFFGSAGLPLAEVERAVDRLRDTLGPGPFGFNLIHSPNEPNLEAAVVDLYIRKNITLVEASAYLDLTLPVVRYRVHGIRRANDGQIVTPNRIVAKVSRVEVAGKFLAPPPQALLQQLVERGDISAEQAHLARQIPMAQDITAEADSAGHTDNRPALALVPTMMALRNRLQKEHNYAIPLRVGAAGGISTPESAAAAFSLGAAYIVTGSVNQACSEAGTSEIVRDMLATAEQADIMMAPAADMFEMGVKLQVLKRGTMFGMRAAKLWEMYRTYKSLDDIPANERTQLEKTLFRQPLESVWEQTQDFFRQRDPAQLSRADRDPQHKMALVFRWYLGLSSHWANAGNPDRRLDYQVWCGPAMGAFNEWVRGSFLEQPNNRNVTSVAMNILYGAAVVLRTQMLRLQGVTVPPHIPDLSPLPLSELQKRLNSSRPNE